MAGAVTVLGRALGARQGDLPPNLNLMAKLLGLGFLYQLLPATYPEPFLPFHPVFDDLRRYAPFRPVMTAACLTGLGLLLLTRRTRLACLLMGGSLMLSILGNKPFYTNGKVFWSLMLLLLGLHDPRSGIAGLRWQFAVMYAGCFVSKIVDPDWRSGQFFESWLGTRRGNDLYTLGAALLPPLWLAKAMAWFVMVMELADAVLFALGRYRLAVWTTLLLHGGILFILWGATFGHFFFAVAVSLLAFIEWPSGARTLTVSPGWSPLAALVRRADLEGDWTVKEGAELAVEYDGVRLAGAAALKAALLYSPVLLHVLYVVCLPSDTVRTLVIAALVALYFPPLEGLWDLAMDGKKAPRAPLAT